LGHRVATPTVHASHIVRGSVQLQHPVRVGTGLLVEAVDVLRHDRRDTPRPLQSRDGPVARIRLQREHFRIAPALIRPTLLPARLIGADTLYRRDTIRLPDAV